MNGPQIDWQPLLTNVAEQSWGVAPGLLPPALVLALRQRLQQLQQAAALRPAAIGKGPQQQHNQQIRSDNTHWLNGDNALEAAFLELLEDLRITANRQLLLGLRRFEAHFAHYPPGACYQTHVDAFHGSRTRVLSAVCYLNDDWPTTAGGELLLYGQDGHSELARVSPRGGTVALFLSEDVPHQVLPANRDRYSIAAWLRVDEPL